MNKWLKNFFMYLDRYFVKYHSLPTLEEAGTRHFKTLVFDAVKKDVSNAILTLIDRERDGDQVDRDLIRSCVQLFETMGMGSLECYTADFESMLLNKTKEYYARKAESWIQQDPTPAYLLKAEQAIEDFGRADCGVAGGGYDRDFFGND
jgi:cullin 1